MNETGCHNSAATHTKDETGCHNSAAILQLEQDDHANASNDDDWTNEETKVDALTERNGLDWNGLHIASGLIPSA